MTGRVKLIEAVKNNSEKQATYREQLGRYRKALNNEFYFEALLIVYAMLEDRLRSFIYYIGAIRRSDDCTLNVQKTKNVLRCLYFGSVEEAMNKKLDIKQISIKENLIRKTLEWAMKQEGNPEDKYLAVLKSEYEGCLDMDGLYQTLSDIDAWRNYRNEIIHGLLNKNMSSLNTDLRKKIEDGMRYARFIDSQVKSLKKQNAIRNKMRIIR